MIVSALLTLSSTTTLEQVVAAAQRLESAGVAAVGFLDGADAGHGAAPFESSTLSARIAAVTSTIGVIASDSALYGFPFHTARRLATLDHVSQGRSGWLVRAGGSPGEAHAYEWRSTQGRGEELHRVVEYVEIARELWSCWEDGAQWPDKDAGAFKDDDRIHRIDYRSTSFRVAGPLDTPPTPQGRPVLLTRIATPQEAATLTPSVDVAILSPAEGHAATELAAVATGAAETAGTPVALLMAAAVGDRFALPSVALAAETARDAGAHGLAVHVGPDRVDEALDALAGLDLTPPGPGGTLAAALGIELPLGGRAA